jgi:hypothetical protein
MTSLHRAAAILGVSVIALGLGLTPKALAQSTVLITKELYNSHGNYGVQYYVSNTLNIYACAYATVDIATNVNGSIQYRTQLNSHDTNIYIGQYVRESANPKSAWRSRIHVHLQAGQCR